MKTTLFKNDEGLRGVSVELDDGNGFDCYEDGSIYPWDDGNAAFNKCAATGTLFCYSDVADIDSGISEAEYLLDTDMQYGPLIPGIREIERTMP